MLDTLAPALERIAPYKAVFSNDYVRMLKGEHVKQGANKRELANALRADIREFKQRENLSRVVVLVDRLDRSLPQAQRSAPKHRRLRKGHGEERSWRFRPPCSTLGRQSRKAARMPTAQPNLALETPGLRN